MNVNDVLRSVNRELRAVATPERAEAEKRYLKSDLEFIGATVPDVRKVAKQLLRDHPEATREELLDIAERLWNAGIFEYRMVAAELLRMRVKLLGPDDFELLERLIRESKTWALVDTISTSVVGPLTERLPESGAVLDRWSTDEDFWVRRAAMLSLLKALRDGAGEFERFARYADVMLEEKEFFIRKAIGWVLRDTSRKRPELVADWVAPRTHRMSGVTIREAIKYLPESQADSFLEAYRAGRPAR